MNNGQSGRRLSRSDVDAPLSGVRVAEFCSTAAGPFCAMLLADMGAEVIKVEPPDGDALRQWPPITDGYSENFAALNRNKKSVVLDLKDAAAARTARRLVLDCDVVVENNRPGVMDRLGLGYAALSEQKPSLVYCSISAYGQTGPRATEGGFDLTMQAAAGVMSVTGEEGGAPVKCGVPISDFASGLYAAYSIAAALLTVRAGGLVLTSMCRCSAARSRSLRCRPASCSVPAAARAGLDPPIRAMLPTRRSPLPMAILRSQRVINSCG